MFSTRKVFIVDTNIFMEAFKCNELELLKGLEIRVPWAVLRELQTLARIAEADKKVLESRDPEKHEAWEKSLAEKGLKWRQINGRKTRIEYAENACSFVHQKINEGTWKTIGTHLELKEWLDGFSEELKERVEMNRADLEVLACCCVAALKYKKKDIVLMTMDGDLGEAAAEEFLIQVHKGRYENR